MASDAGDESLREVNAALAGAFSVGSRDDPLAAVVRRWGSPASVARAAARTRARAGAVSRGIGVLLDYLGRRVGT